MALSMKDRYARLDLSKLPESYKAEFEEMSANSSAFSDEEINSIYAENFNELYGLVEKKYPEAIKTGGTVQKVKPKTVKVISKKEKKAEKEFELPGKIEKEFEDFEKNKSKLKGYAQSISEATGETDPKKLAEIEDVMRNVIFHSTLDWQSKEEFDKGAKAAVKVIEAEKKIKQGKPIDGHKPKKLTISDIEFIEDQLINNEVSTDEELITLFVVEVGLNETQAHKWVSKRNQYLNAPPEKTVKYSVRTGLKKEARKEKDMVKTRDGKEINRRDPKNKGLKFFDENGKEWECTGYNAKLDECIFVDSEGKKISSCLKDMYWKNPVEKRAKGDMVDECRETLKKAGFSIKKHVAGSKVIKRSEPRPEREIIKERVEGTFKPILKDISGSEEKDEKFKDTIAALDRIQKLFTKLLNRLNNLAEDNKADSIQKIEKLLTDILD